MDEQQQQQIIKIVSKSNCNLTGKTTLLKCFFEDEYQRQKAFQNFQEFTVKTIEKIKLKKNLLFQFNRQYKLQIWDLSVHYAFRAINEVNLRGSDAIIFVYDITYRYSFENLDTLFQEVDNLKKRISFNPAIFLVGNKCDLKEQRQVSYEEGKQLAEQFGCFFIETSSLTGQNVNVLYEAILNQSIKIQ